MCMVISMDERDDTLRNGTSHNKMAKRAQHSNIYDQCDHKFTFLNAVIHQDENSIF